MANYSNVKSAANALVAQLNNGVDSLASALAGYIKGGANVSENDIYNIIKDLPQELQVKVLIKALASKEMAKTPSYVERNSRSRGII